MNEIEKQRFREEGVLIDDFLEVGKKIEELSLGEDLKEKWESLLLS